ncbi:MAG: hypothetical protein HY814_14725 [Candidatus Riflebacteria bacterium]|nr:hypothetical protein [Candidatus Riflebacteria bacterium]
MAARPAAFPQIDRDEHFALVGVKDPETPCMKCHDPHEPLFLDRKLDDARLHPIIHQCRNCHSKAVQPTAARPPNHPVVFECKYCHRDLAQSFERKPHGRLGCNRCHIFHSESDEAGRIVKNRDPRFCLLCHKDGDFRGGKGAPPLIRWPDHLSDVGLEPDPKQSCLDCHMKDAIHDTAPAPAGPAKEGASQ